MVRSSSGCSAAATLAMQRAVMASAAVPFWVSARLSRVSRKGTSDDRCGAVSSRVTCGSVLIASAASAGETVALLLLVAAADAGPGAGAGPPEGLPPAHSALPLSLLSLSGSLTDDTEDDGRLRCLLTALAALPLPLAWPSLGARRCSCVRAATSSSLLAARSDSLPLPLTSLPLPPSSSPPDATCGCAAAAPLPPGPSLRGMMPALSCMRTVELRGLARCGRCCRGCLLLLPKMAVEEADAEAEPDGKLSSNAETDDAPDAG